VVDFDVLNRFHIIDGIDVLTGLDHRVDLLALSPTEFEHLIRQLFEEMGMKSWVTRASKDEGVDAVATNEDPILGGMCVIQAKRYSKVVGLESVQALAGVLHDKAATRGILVTTSWFGTASWELARRHGRLQLIEGRNLKLYIREHLNRDVLISLPKVPPGWLTEDIT